MVRLYFHYVAAQLRSQLQYRGSFLLQLLGTVFMAGVELLGVWALFNRFGSIDGWKLEEVAILYGLVFTGFGVAEIVGRGFDLFSSHIRTGTFDLILLRPRTTFLQVAGDKFAFNRLGRMFLGVTVLIWGLSTTAILWNLFNVFLLIATVTAVIVLFIAIFIATAAVMFWTVQSLELFAIVTNGSVDAGTYPVTIYRRFMRRFLLFFIPIGTVTYFPVTVLLDRPDPLGVAPWLGWIAPLAGPLFMLVALLLWRLGVRHYSSTGS